MPKQANPPSAKTVNGMVEGLVDSNNVAQLQRRTLRCASVGDLRWKEPQPVKITGRAQDL